MKVSKSKVVALLLIILFMSTIIFGCGGNEPLNETPPVTDSKSENEESVSNVQNAQDENDLNDDSAEETANSSIETRPDYDLPEVDLNGYNFRILSRSQESNAHWGNHDISADEETGDPINDAVYKRNRKVEELYNIKITNMPESDMGAIAARSILAGNDDYDLLVMGMRNGQENLITKGYLLDLYQIPYVDLTKQWWDQRAVEQLSLNNRLYSTACDLTVRDKDAIMIVLFNKTLTTNYELGNLYELVLSGKWTLDKMHEMMKSAARDLNGDGQMGLDDQYGLLSQQRLTQYLFNGTGEYISKLNSDKIPEITLYNERAASVAEKIGEMQSDRNITVIAEQANGIFEDIWDGFQVPLFAESRALFYHTGMNRVTLLRTMENDFGILPPPKYDEVQQNYYAAVDAWCMSAVSVPITVPNTETTGLILETLAYESRYLLLPAYYDINLKSKFARDEESSAMIDIILNNRLYDLGDIYYWGNVISFFDGLSNGADSSLSTFWDKVGNKTILAMEKTIASITAID